MNIKSLIFTLCILPLFVRAQTLQDTIDVKTFQLGEVVLYSNNPKDKITQKHILQYNKPDVAQALNLLPSVVMNLTGSRNESNIYMRGYDIHSIPVYADGIPVYVPYDGYVDLARFTTADLSKIDVSKGFSSVLYGPNAMGGTINLISRKPVNAFELKTKAGLLSGEGYDNFVSIGSRLDQWLLQATFAQFDRAYMPLSNNFELTEAQNSFKRNNSYRKDRKFTIKTGFIPNDSDEYVLSYINQKGRKGNPVYLGTDENIRIRYWQWPNWDKESVYFISKTKISPKINLKSRLYYDQFDNALSSYDDDTYSSQTFGYAFNSVYRDKTYGGTIESALDFRSNTLKTAFHIKRDEHRDISDETMPLEMIDNTYTFGIEDVITSSQGSKLISGASVSYRQGVKAEDRNQINADGTYATFDNTNNTAFNLQFAGLYKLNTKAQINASAAYKTRFATMKDRFSYRSGHAIPNPDLASEEAVNIDLGMTFQINAKLYIKPEIFSNHLFNTIQYVDEVQPGLSQIQNTGQSHFYGFDFTGVYQMPLDIQWTLNYAFIKRKNLSNPDLLFVDVPEHHIFSALVYKGLKNFDFNLNGEFASDRYSTSYGNISKAYIVFNTRAAYQFNNGIAIEAGVNNVFDKNYTITEGFPEAGRSYFMSLMYDFSVK
ncbi:MAG: TonB-dependent receptor [Bacteroidetes bacterium]|nr:MAG: TonB-dependent receptor [Bacteroidota bacterium]